MLDKTGGSSQISLRPTLVKGPIPPAVENANGKMTGALLTTSFDLATSSSWTLSACGKRIVNSFGIQGSSKGIEHWND